jgi:hypothetical protein
MAILGGSLASDLDETSSGRRLPASSASSRGRSTSLRHSHLLSRHSWQPPMRILVTHLPMPHPKSRSLSKHRLS